jgi:hypothetical protein
MQRIRMTIYCDPEVDADLLAIIKQWPERTRSAHLKALLRQNLASNFADPQRIANMERRIAHLETVCTAPSPSNSTTPPTWNADAMHQLFVDFNTGDDESC